MEYPRYYPQAPNIPAYFPAPNPQSEFHMHQQGRPNRNHVSYGNSIPAYTHATQSPTTQIGNFIVTPLPGPPLILAGVDQCGARWFREESVQQPDQLASRQSFECRWGYYNVPTGPAGPNWTSQYNMRPNAPYSNPSQDYQHTSTQEQASSPVNTNPPRAYTSSSPGPRVDFTVPPVPPSRNSASSGTRQNLPAQNSRNLDLGRPQNPIERPNHPPRNSQENTGVPLNRTTSATHVANQQHQSPNVVPNDQTQSASRRSAYSQFLASVRPAEDASQNREQNFNQQRIEIQDSGSEQISINLRPNASETEHKITLTLNVHVQQTSSQSDSTETSVVNRYTDSYQSRYTDQSRYTGSSNLRDSERQYERSSSEQSSIPVREHQYGRSRHQDHLSFRNRMHFRPRDMPFLNPGNLNPTDARYLSATFRNNAYNSAHQWDFNAPSNPYQHTLSINPFADISTNAPTISEQQAFAFSNQERERLLREREEQEQTSQLTGERRRSGYPDFTPASNTQGERNLEVPSENTPSFGQALANPDNSFQGYSNGNEEGKRETEEQKIEEEAKTSSRIESLEESKNVESPDFQFRNPFTTPSPILTQQQRMNPNISSPVSPTTLEVANFGAPDAAVPRNPFTDPAINPNHIPSSLYELINQPSYVPARLNNVYDPYREHVPVGQNVIDSSDGDEPVFSEDEDWEDEDGGLLESEIESIEVTIEPEGNETQTCSICYCDIQAGDTILTLPCEHKYHADWIKPWLRQSATCPLDRQNMLGMLG